MSQIFIIRCYTIDYELIGEEWQELEIICIKIRTENSSLVLVSYYNRPFNSKDNNTINRELFYQLEKKYKRVILCGDLNARTKSLGCNKVTNMNANILEEVIANSSFLVANDKNIPTYHIQRSKSANSKDYHEVLDYAMYTNELKSQIIETEVLDNN